MEVLKKSRKGALLLLACAILIICALAVTTGNGEHAYADNSDVIGGATPSDDIVFTDVTVREAGLSYSNNVDGATFKVKVPYDAYNISVAYEVEFSTSVWPIGGEPTDKDLPATYLKIEGEGKPQVEEYLNYVGGWSAVTNEGNEQVFTVNVKINGTLYVKYNVLTETEEGEKAEATVIGEKEITIVDVLAPDCKSVTMNKIPDKGSYRYEVKTVFYDLSQTGAIPSARSGMRYAEIFYSEVAIENLTEEQIKGLTTLDKWEQKSYTSAVLNEVTLGFTLYDDGSSDGYYYYILFDRAGNYGIFDFFGGKFVGSNDSRYVVTTTSNGETTELNVSSNISLFAREIDEHKDDITPSLYETVSYAYSELVWAFNKEYKDYTEEARLQEVSKLYWSFVRGTYQTFLDAIEGATYEQDITNADLLFGNIRITNFEGSVASAKGGQTVKAEINVARYDFDEVPSEVITLADMGNRGKVFKLQYKLTVDGSSAYVPSSALWFEIGGEPDTFINTDKFQIVIKNGDQYAVKEYAKGVNWFLFSTEYNTADIFIVVPESSLPSRYQTDDGLSGGAIAGICIGTVVGVAGIGVGVYFLLKKKGVLDAKKTAEQGLDTEEAPAEENVTKKTPSNKSKKRKKK